MQAEMVNGYRLNVSRGSDGKYKVTVSPPQGNVKNTVARCETESEAIKIKESLSRLYAQITLHPASYSPFVVPRPRITLERNWIGSHQVGCVRINTYSDGSVTVKLDKHVKGWKEMRAHLQAMLGVYTEGDTKQAAWHFLSISDIPESGRKYLGRMA